MLRHAAEGRDGRDAARELLDCLARPYGLRVIVDADEPTDERDRMGTIAALVRQASELLQAEVAQDVVDLSARREALEAIRRMSAQLSHDYAHQERRAASR